MFACPDHINGFAYVWRNGELSVQLSPKDTTVATHLDSQQLTAHRTSWSCT